MAARGRERETKATKARFQRLLPLLEIKSDTGRLSDKEKVTYDDIKRKLARLQDFERHCDAHDKLNQRIIGEVIASPSIGACMGGFRRDWALVALDETKFVPPQIHVLIANFNNKVWDDIDKSGMTTALKEHDTNKDLLALNAYFTMDTIHRQDPDLLKRTTSPDDRNPPALHVYMSGAKSKATHGVLNRVKSYHCSEPRDGGLVWTADLCIIASTGDDDRFSKRGDGGAVVFAMIPDGGADQVRVGIVGLIWGGHNDIRDISYATPFEYVVQDIEHFTGCKVQGFEKNDLPH
jgi:hypothetical protein